MATLPDDFSVSSARVKKQTFHRFSDIFSCITTKVLHRLKKISNVVFTRVE